MGLDMYLSAAKYIAGYDFLPQEERTQYFDLVGMFSMADAVDEHTPSATVSFTVGYWRKANAIHKWFVDNAQGGVDDCRDAYVSREQLIELSDACKTVLASLHMKSIGGEEEVASNIEVAEALLPTASGFFFGGTGYDEWYKYELENTISIIDRALRLVPTEWYFEYHSSW